MVLRWSVRRWASESPNSSLQGTSRIQGYLAPNDPLSHRDLQ